MRWQYRPDLVRLQGLRIGSATVKGLGLALKLPVIEVPTVDALLIISMEPTV